MLRRGLPLLPAERIGHELGLVVPPEDQHLFWQAPTGEQPIAGWGTQIGTPGYSLDEAFERLEVPLRASLHLINEFESPADLGAYLTEALAHDRDVLVCYDYGTLWGTNSRNGHVNVFDRFDGDGVRLIDPGAQVPKWRRVSLEDLYRAMTIHGVDRSGGFWELTTAAPPSRPRP
jgi:hypothetical protein